MNIPTLGTQSLDSKCEVRRPHHVEIMEEISLLGRCIEQLEDLAREIHGDNDTGRTEKVPTLPPRLSVLLSEGGEMIRERRIQIEGLIVQVRDLLF